MVFRSRQRVLGASTLLLLGLGIALGLAKASHHVRQVDDADDVTYDSKAGYEVRYPGEWWIEGFGEAIALHPPDPAGPMVVQILAFPRDLSSLPRPRNLQVLSSVRPDGRRVLTWEHRREGLLKRVTLIEWSADCPENSCPAIEGILGMSLRVSISGSLRAWSREADNISRILRSLRPRPLSDDRTPGPATSVILEIVDEGTEEPTPDAVARFAELDVRAESDFDGVVAFVGLPMDRECMLATLEVRAPGYGQWRVIDNPLYSGQVSYGDVRLQRQDQESVLGPPRADPWSCTRDPEKQARIGVPYEHTLHTHCGVVEAFFDGRAWDADPPLTDDGGGNPPEGWADDENYTSGTMILLAKNVAEFRGRRGQVARFKPRPPNALDAGECN